jgi:hypothetical protein
MKSLLAVVPRNSHSFLEVVTMARIAYREVGRNIDTLEVNGIGPLHDGVADFLDTMQQYAIEERDTHKRRAERDRVRSETCWEVDGQPLLLRAHGANQGMWRWLAECPAAKIDIGLGELNGITCQARLSSPFLWQHGYRQAWSIVEQTLSEIGAFHYQPSEVHLAVDVAGKSLESLKESDFVRRGHVTRWHLEDAQILDVPPSHAYLSKRAQHDIIVRYREPETLSFSLAAPHSGVVYNKPREIRVKSHDKLWFAEIWRANGWDGKAPITRTEMRYERETLHEFGHARRCLKTQCNDGHYLTTNCHDPTCTQLHGIETMDDLFANLDAMWRYSTHEWLRHTVPTQDKNRSRWPTSAFWKVVQSATFEQSDALPLVRQRQHAFHKERILSTVYGYLESLTAHLYAVGEMPNGSDLEDALIEMINGAEAHYNKRGSSFGLEVAAKVKKIGVAS